MTRNKFFIALVAAMPALGQYKFSSNIIIRKNGVCPVCGEEAGKFDKKKVATGGCLVGAIWPATPPCGEPNPRLVRCNKCSVAFYQDAE